jgi:hypothetical protein
MVTNWLIGRILVMDYWKRHRYGRAGDRDRSDAGG